MFRQPRYFFEPLVETELNLLAQDQVERELIVKIMLYHLLFVFLSKTKPSLRQTVVNLIKDNLYNPEMLTKITPLDSNINQELLERALSFIITNIQTRLEKSTV